jgi:hypothetical protein
MNDIKTIISAAKELNLHHIYRDSDHYSLEVDGIEVIYASMEDEIRYAYKRLKHLIPHEAEAKAFFLTPNEDQSVSIYVKKQIEL